MIPHQHLIYDPSTRTVLGEPCLRTDCDRASRRWVLDAAYEWAKTIIGSPEMPNPKLRELLYAVDRWQRPPETPAPISIATMILDRRYDEARAAIGGDPVLAIEVVVALCDLKHRADTVFDNANVVADIINGRYSHPTSKEQ